MKTLKLFLFLVSLSGSLFSQLSSRPVSLSFSKSQLNAIKSVRELSSGLPKDAKVVSYIITAMKGGKLINLVGKEEQFSPQMLDLFKKVVQGSKIFTDIKYTVSQNTAFKHKNLTLSIRVSG